MGRRDVPSRPRRPRHTRPLPIGLPVSVIQLLPASRSLPATPGTFPATPGTFAAVRARSRVPSTFRRYAPSYAGSHQPTRTYRTT